MLSIVNSGATIGIDGYIVRVEVDVSPGLPYFTIVGLPDTAVRESRERVKAALMNVGFEFPVKRITINLAPADIRKEGTLYDLPIAIGLLSSMGIVRNSVQDNTMLLGELSLDGKVRPIKGALPITIEAARKHIPQILLPSSNAKEASFVKDISVYGVSSILDAVALLNGTQHLSPVTSRLNDLLSEDVQYPFDFKEIKGQEYVKRALEIAATGGHNIIMVGPPGSGKTLLAKCMPSILPLMTFSEIMETTKVYSAAGLLNHMDTPLILNRPFRAPHHTISDAGLIGGGNIPKPGEISLAHNGILFFDELPEFRRNTLESLRQPMEDGTVTISRAHTTCTLPSKFIFMGAANPCPCGYYGDQEKDCKCSISHIRRYRSRMSGPLLDRIDLHVEVARVPACNMTEEKDQEPSAMVRKRVQTARNIQLKRFIDKPNVSCNAHMNQRLIKEYCRLDQDGKNLLKLAIEKFGLTARGYSRVLKIARTIADLEAIPEIAPHHISEAIQYRVQESL